MFRCGLGFAIGLSLGERSRNAELFLQASPSVSGWVPGTLGLFFGAVFDQIILEGTPDSGSRVKTTYRRSLPACSSKPSKPLFRGDARGDLQRHVSLEVIAGLIQLRIRINHHRGTVVCCIKDIEMPIRIRLEQHPHTIALVKLVRWIDTYCQAIRVAHEQGQAQAYLLNDWFLL